MEGERNSTTVDGNNVSDYFLESNCNCQIDKNLCIKEARKGFVDPFTMQEYGNFVTYVIESFVNKRKQKLKLLINDFFKGKSTRRRYSDFELLQNHLQRVYPFYAIPKIPEKQSIGSLFSF
jgi:hypothetical protein